MAGYGGGGQAGVKDSGWGGPMGSAGRQPTGGTYSNDQEGHLVYHAPTKISQNAAMRLTGANQSKVGNSYRAVTRYIHGEPTTIYQKISGPIPTSTAAMKVNQSALFNKLGKVSVRNMGPGLPPNMEQRNTPTINGYNNGTIGPQNPNGYTGFGPNSYGNSGLMNNHPAGKSTSVGLGSRMASTGYTGGVSRTQGNVLGQGGNLGYGGAGYASGSRGSGGLTGRTGGNAAGGPGAGRGSTTGHGF